jgi:type IV pilus assembly protein PilQ
MYNDLNRKRKLLQFVYLGVAMIFLGLHGCASAPRKAAQEPKAVTPRVEAIRIQSVNASETRVEVVGSQPLPYTAFKLTDPPRVVMDVQGIPESQVLQTKQVNDGKVKQISIEKYNSNNNTTKVVVLLARAMDYTITKEGRSLIVDLHSLTAAESQTKETPEEKPVQARAETNASMEKKPVSEPRIFFKPEKDHQVQVLGVDFAMLQAGKSRLTITTSKKGTYDLQRIGPKGIRLNLEDATIPPLLMRRLDATYFKGAVDRVKANLLPEKKQVSLDITLREMVPFHIDQTNSTIYIDFGKTAVGPREKNLVPMALTESEKRTSTLHSESPASMMKLSAPMKDRRTVWKKYVGAPMTMDFVNADVTNILRLIGEVSNLNIIWGPEVKGKVSMRLRHVPWDQALDLVLENNDLGMRREGNVIWVTTRTKLTQIETEEKKKREQEEAERKKRLEAQKEAKATEPLVTEYLTVNYVDVDSIKKLIDENVKGPRGKLSVDSANKTIIMTDTASNIKAAEELKERQDKPIKQVMIEARIVEARTSFSRELGVNWSGSYQTQHDPWGGTGDGTYGYNFSTNLVLPTTEATMAGVSFVNTAATKLLNAQIALAETEGEVKTLSAPKVVTRDTIKAIIKQGTKIVIPSGTDSNGNTTYQQVDAALKLEVTPKITPNNMVVMNIDVSDDSPDYANARGDNVPINTKNAQTEMMIASGDTVVIGGIYKENKSKTESGTPWLRDVPILGWLFKDRGTTSERSELLIFLTPTVVSVPGRM